MPSSVVETTGPPPTAFGVAARSELPATGKPITVPLIGALALAVVGAILIYAARHNREVRR